MQAVIAEVDNCLIYQSYACAKRQAKRKELHFLARLDLGLAANALTQGYHPNQARCLS